MDIRLAGIVEESVVDGDGIRFVVFCQGCTHGCIGCHNKQSWDIDGGYVDTVESVVKRIECNPLLSGVTLSGGEPLLQPTPLLQLCRYCCNIGLSVWCYTGYSWEQVVDMCHTQRDVASLIGCIDVLVDGKYQQDNRDETLRFRGSRNQRLIDVKRSLVVGHAVQYDQQ